MPPRLKLHIHYTKSLKRDNIYKLCLWMPEEHNRLVLTSWHFPKLRYRAKCIPFLHFTESLERDNIEIFDLVLQDDRNC